MPQTLEKRLDWALKGYGCNNLRSVCGHCFKLFCEPDQWGESIQENPDDQYYNIYARAFNGLDGKIIGGLLDGDLLSTLKEIVSRGKGYPCKEGSRRTAWRKKRFARLRDYFRRAIRDNCQGEEKLQGFDDFVKPVKRFI